MRPRDERAERRRRRPSARKQTGARRGAERTRRRCLPWGIASPIAVPGATLAALALVAILAALRAASGPLREWSLAIAMLLGVAGCWLCAVAVAHVAASVAARRVGAGQ